MDWDRLGWIKMECCELGWNRMVWNRLGWIKMKCSGLGWNQMEYDGMNCLHSDLKVVSSHSKNR